MACYRKTYLLLETRNRLVNPSKRVFLLLHVLRSTPSTNSDLVGRLRIRNIISSTIIDLSSALLSTFLHVLQPHSQSLSYRYKMLHEFMILQGYLLKTGRSGRQLSRGTSSALTTTPVVL
jgi:hypothetical protein